MFLELGLIFVDSDWSERKFNWPTKTFTSMEGYFQIKGGHQNFATGLNFILGIVKKYESDQAVLLPKWFPQEYSILTKEQWSLIYFLIYAYYDI